MGLYKLVGLDRYSVLTGLTENVNMTRNMSDHEDKKDLELNSDTAEIYICGIINIRWRYFYNNIIFLLQKKKNAENFVFIIISLFSSEGHP
jgi:hypothetical protein